MNGNDVFKFRELSPGETEITLACPCCKSNRIGHGEQVIVVTKIARSYVDEDGELQVSDFADEMQPDFQTSESIDSPWQCMDCKEYLEWDADARALVGQYEDA
jgi:hypothetical protein